MIPGPGQAPPRPGEVPPGGQVPPGPESPPSTVWLIRHAETDWNADGRFQGQSDTALSAFGHRQAAALGRRLAPTGPLALYSSDLDRAAETARIIAEAGGWPLVLDPALREVDVGRWQGLTFAEVESSLPDSMAKWRAGCAGFRFPEGETYEEAANRALHLINRLAAEEPGRSLAIVSHGGVLRALLVSVLGLEHDPRWRLGPLANAGLSAIRGGPGRWRMTLFNDTCHLMSLRSGRKSD